DRQEGEHHEDQRRHDRPDHLERRVAVAVDRLVARSLPVQHQEAHQQHRHEHERGAGDVVDEIEEVVELLAVRGDVLGEKAHHRSRPVLFDRRGITASFRVRARAPGCCARPRRSTQPPGAHAIAGSYFFSSKATFVSCPALTSTSLVCLPSTGWTTSTLCLPGGTFSSLNAPFASLTAVGLSVT